MRPGPGEPLAGPWRVAAIGEFAAGLTGWRPVGRPLLVAVDGRGGSGKTALARRLSRELAPAAVVHSDDIAWNHSRFGWADLMVDGVLTPLRDGREVDYRPPGWVRQGRDGRVHVPASASTVIIEGVGVSRRDLAPLVDVLVWVQSDYAEARRRGIARDMETEGRTEPDAIRNWDEWDEEEVPFLADDRPWERAHWIVTTASAVPHDPETEVAVRTA